MDQWPPLYLHAHKYTYCLHAVHTHTRTPPLPSLSKLNHTALWSLVQSAEAGLRGKATGCFSRDVKLLLVSFQFYLLRTVWHLMLLLPAVFCQSASTETRPDCVHLWRTCVFLGAKCFAIFVGLPPAASESSQSCGQTVERWPETGTAPTLI